MKKHETRQVNYTYAILRFKIEKSNVLNQQYADEIQSYLYDIIDGMGIYWKNKDDRKDMLSIFDEFMKEYFMDSGKILNYKIICDKRNNPKEDTDKNIWKILFEYQQKNCYMITKLNYVIEEETLDIDDSGYYDIY